MITLRRALIAAALLGAPALASAQDVRELDPLSPLDPAYRRAVELILDSARVAGLPTNPIESKALEGISKRASGRAIVNVARDLFHGLQKARNALGPEASVAELTAAANALRAGLPEASLTRLARDRSGKDLTIPLVVLSDLVTRGVPRDTASSTILQLWQRGAADEDFLGLWRGVERDIVSGTDPGIALMNRAREIPSRVPPPAVPPAGARPDDRETANR